MNAEQAIRELRRLTNERDEGLLTREQYRRQRSALLDGLVGLEPAETHSDATRPRGKEEAARPAVSEAAIEEAPATAAPAATLEPRKSFAKLAIVVVVLALVGGVAIATFLRYRLANKPLQVAPLPTHDAAAAVSMPTLLADFLQRGDWSDAAIGAFNRDWWNLSDSEVVATLGSDSARAASAELQSRLQRYAEHTNPDGSTLKADSPLVLMAHNLDVKLPQGLTFGANSGGRTEAPPVRSPASPAPPSNPTKAGAAVPPPKPVPPSGSENAAVQTVSPPGDAGNPSSAVSASAVAGTNATQPQELKTTMDAGAAGDPCAAFYKNPRRRACRDALSDGEVGPALMVIPPGKLQIQGATPQDAVGEIGIARPIAAMVSEISVREFQRYCAQVKQTCPAVPWTDVSMPMVNVSLNDANEYAAWLSKLAGFHYRLPTQSEWEYVARAGVAGEPGADLATLNPNTDARYSAEGAALQAPVSEDDATFKTNAFGIRHMLGNVREWVQDPPSGADGAGVVRGGSYRDNAAHVRPGAREMLPRGTRDVFTGFRLVRDVSPAH